MTTQSYLKLSKALTKLKKDKK